MIEQFQNTGITLNKDTTDVFLRESLGGFDKNFNNEIFHKINNHAIKYNNKISVYYTNYILDCVKEKYKNINFVFNYDRKNKWNFSHFFNYKKHPLVDFENFICSFNGGYHVSRGLLVSIMENQKCFKLNYSSKNFKIDNDQVQGHLQSLDLSDEEIEIFSKFFKNSNEFNNKIYTFGHKEPDQYNHKDNIYKLEKSLTKSFLHIVSESLATSYHPYVTEKFLYSVVTRGLFLAYGQPNWHSYVEKYFGFKKYKKIFNYDFDLIENPVKRLIRLFEIILKFKNLSSSDFMDLYLLEKDTIDFNYNHYFSKDYYRHMKQFDNIHNR